MIVKVKLEHDHLNSDFISIEKNYDEMLNLNKHILEPLQDKINEN